MVVLVMAVSQRRKREFRIDRVWSYFRRQKFYNKLFFIIAGGLALSVILMAFKAALLPPHLPQEYDAINYHYSLPRQHLILKSFAHILWSSADLWPLPVQFALSPNWFVTEIPNKYPQFLFVIGLLVVAGRLVNRFNGNSVQLALMIFAVLGTHALGIQLGTAMLDIVLCYLFLAALDSFLHGDYDLALAEAAFLFWSKANMPAQLALTILGTYFFWNILSRIGCKQVSWVFNQESVAKFENDFSKKSGDPKGRPLT